MAAGVIDALPAIAGWVYYADKIGAAELAGAVVGGAAASAPAELIFGGSVLLYLLHTTLFEVLTGRTPGKMIFGLRVVSLDGTPPTRGQFLTRNLLRVVDVGLAFLPVLLVPFSPLRQRPGDTAAGTLVVSGPPGAEPAGDAPAAAADGAATAATPATTEPAEVDESEEE